MPFPFGRRKEKASTVVLADVLCYSLSLSLTKKRIRETAKDFNFKIKGDEDFKKISAELFALNMWFLVRACETVIKDVDIRNDCLDHFHRLVYVRDGGGTEQNLGEWMKFMGTKYIEYTKAMETEHPSGSLWVLAKVVNKNLFGEVKEDAFVQFAIGNYLGISMKYQQEGLREWMKSFNIVQISYDTLIREVIRDLHLQQG